MEQARSAAAELLMAQKVEARWPQSTDAFLEAHRVESMLLRRLYSALDGVPNTWHAQAGVSAQELAAAIGWKLAADAAVAAGGAEAALPPLPPQLLAKHQAPLLTDYMVVEREGQQCLVLRREPSPVVIAREDWCAALVRNMTITFGDTRHSTRLAVCSNIVHVKVSCKGKVRCFCLPGVS